MSDDDRLEQRLRTLAQEADAPPSLVVDAARAAFLTRDLDAELAELVADSAVDDPALVTRAIVSDVRMLSFECGDVTVELDVEADTTARTVRLHGLVVGAVGQVVIVRSDAQWELPLDEDGRFDSDTMPAGPLRLVLTTADGRRVTTSWVTV